MGWRETFFVTRENSAAGKAVKKCSYARQSVVYVVENKCFPPSGDVSYGINHCLGEAGYYLLRASFSSWIFRSRLYCNSPSARRAAC
ncbi:MAG: hypothetical protein ACI9G1_001276 [Pirellulaceae bacterium]|jgi:hypothetical protein